MNFIQNLLSRIVRQRKLFAFFVFCFFFAVGIVKAQYSLEDHQKALGQNEGQNLQKFSEQNFAGFINSTNTALLGCATCDNPQLKTGALPFTTIMIGDIYGHPAASGLAYMEDLGKRFNIVQPAYAQTGTGFNELRPLLPIWKAFRDFAYAFFAVVFVAIGLAIMFRMKLDPRTVLTLQSAIPRIVVALLLVTFSYAIAGFMIDLMYVLIGLSILVFGRVGGVDVSALQTQYFTGGLPLIWTSLWGYVGGGTSAVIGGLAAIGGLVGVAFMGGLTLSTGGIAAAVIGIGGALFLLILLLIVLYIMFKLFIELLKAYVNIILAVILGPLQIALGVIPGFPGFGLWFKNLLTNILIFPAVAFVLLLGSMIMGIGGGLWHPPLLAGDSLVGHVLPVLLGLGIMFTLQQVPQAVRALMAGKTPEFSIGDTAGAGFYPVSKPTGALISGAERAGSTAAAGAIGSAIKNKFIP